MSRKQDSLMQPAKINKAFQTSGFTYIRQHVHSEASLLSNEELS